MKLVQLIDDNGFWITTQLIDDNDALGNNQVDIPIPIGLYKPKWKGIGWEEGEIQEKIKDIQNQLPNKVLENIQKENVQLVLQLEQLQEENNLLKTQNQTLSDRSDFIEDVIAEMAMTVYK